MQSYPKMYIVWLTKHVSGCCDTNKQMSYWTPGWPSLCSSCGNVVDRASHVTQCRESGMRKMLCSLMEKLADWVYDTTATYNMAMSLTLYLVAQGERTFEESTGELGSTLCDPNNNCVQLSSETDSIGWDYLLEGSASKQWLLFMRTGLTVRNKITCNRIF